MAEHESSIGASDEWYTPPEIFAAINMKFDLDPCAPADKTHCASYAWCSRLITKHDDGLNLEWAGKVFVNPPFGGRRGHVPWLKKFIDHRNGIAIVRAYTSADWFHDLVPEADAVLFPRGKTKFIRPDGSIGKAPGHGVVIIGMGIEACDSLRLSNLGHCPEAWGNPWRSAA